ncbi:allatotropin-like [Pectinophora gossypiella]|uniref:allatotropin-like n=1 Tax=Pectinophora gossypiella TaxID=13191 RepID=UPI00214E391F|nr:allatotropin-like [Pectinophora gossypiella]
MNISMQLAVVVAAACLCLSDAAPDGRLVRKQQRPTRGFKNVEMMTARGFGKRDQPSTRTERDVNHQTSSERSHRGTPTFKSPSVGVARDFGKRTMEDNEEQEGYAAPSRRRFNPKTSLMVANGFGKRSSDETVGEVYGLDNFWERLESAPETDGQEGNEEKTMESIPMDWFVNEMLNNPDFARSVVRKFIDLNQDGMLSTDELLRNVV